MPDDAAIEKAQLLQALGESTAASVKVLVSHCQQLHAEHTYQAASSFSMTWLKDRLLSRHVIHAGGHCFVPLRHRC